MSDFDLELGLMPYLPTTWSTGLVLETGVDGYNINNVASRLEWLFHIEQTGTLTSLGFLYGGTKFFTTVSINTTLEISLQGVDATTGQADGVKRTSQAFRPPLTFFGDPVDWDQGWQWVNVAGASVTRGEFVAVVIEYLAGPVGPPWSNFKPRILSTSLGRKGWPYSAASGGGTRVTSNNGLIIGYMVDGKAYGWPIADMTIGGTAPVGFPITGFSGGAMRALRFQMDVGWADTFKVAGCTWVGKHSSNTTLNYSMRLYDGTTEIGRTTVDVDHSADFLTSGFHTVMFDEGELPQLDTGKPYRLAIVADDPQTLIAMEAYHCASSVEQAAFPGGAEFYMSERDDAGDSWTDLPEARPLIDLIINDWGVPVEEAIGLHLKVTPKYNDTFLVQHADDQIENNIVEVPDGTNPNEFPGVPIGNAVESYSGYATVEVFKDPDADRSLEFLIHPEQPIEELKFLRWEPFVDETTEIVFRFRAAEGSAVFREVIRYVRVILPP
jgi:hypothetical protein